MNFTIKKDVTERTVKFRVFDVPDLDVTQGWNRHKKVIRPDRVRITLHNGRLSTVVIAGPVMLATGRPSDFSSGSRRFSEGYANLSDLPEWAQNLVDIITRSKVEP